MTNLKLRKMRFEFDGDIPFQWNPTNPLFGYVGLFLSFVAPPFERYMVAACRQAMPHIKDPAIAAEADAFLRQEALHARAHRMHVAALTTRYPGLAEVSAELDRRYDVLLGTKPLRYHLAYAADIEATFTPLFNVWLRHRDTLIDNGDHRVAPLFLWHLVEEIEHRSSAYLIYNEVVDDPWYRLRVLPRVFGHMGGCLNVACRGFDEHVPLEDRVAPAAEVSLTPSALVARVTRSLPVPGRPRVRPSYPGPFSSIALREELRMVARLIVAQHPRHSPDDEVTPPFADEWMDEYDRGRDVARWYADVSTEGSR